MIFTKSKTLITTLPDLHGMIFVQRWPTRVDGVLIGLMSVLVFAWARPWGLAGGLRKWSDWFFYSIGVFPEQPASMLIHSGSLLALGLLWSALAAALSAKQFAIRIPPPLELIKGSGGGLLMGLGASGRRVFLHDSPGYPLSVIAILVFLLVWLIIVSCNESSQRWVVRK